MARVDHKPFIVRLINQDLQQFFPNTFSAPADEPLMYRSPFPIIWRQVTPGRSGAQHPKYRVYKTPVVLGDSAPLSPLPRQMRLQQRPYFVTYVMSMIGSFHFSSHPFLWLPLFYHIHLHLCRHYLEKQIFSHLSCPDFSKILSRYNKQQRQQNLHQRSKRKIKISIR